MGNKARSPFWFPKMKVRGAGRRNRAMWDRAARSFMLAGQGAERVAYSMDNLVKILGGN